MKASLSIRTYTKRMNRHVHESYHQLVLPTQGNISIDMDGFVGRVAVGDCIVIPQGVAHGFNADEAAHFIVADMEKLPSHLLDGNVACFLRDITFT